MIEYVDAGAPSVRCGEAEIAGRRIAAAAVPYAGDSGKGGFRFDPLARRLVHLLDSRRVAVGPPDPESWARAIGRCPGGPVVVGPGSPVEEIRGAGLAAAEGAARAQGGRGVYLLDPDPAGLPRTARGFVALFSWKPSGLDHPQSGLRAAVAREIPAGGILPLVPGWTDEPEFLQSWLEGLASAGAAFACGVPVAGDGESRRAVIDARESLGRLSQGFFERVHHGDWAAGTAAGLRRLAEMAAERGLAVLPPRPRGAGEPRANSDAAARLEERALEFQADEHRAAMLHAAARWIDESGRDLGAVVREGNFARVFPFAALAAEAEAAFRNDRP